MPKSKRSTGKVRKDKPRKDSADDHTDSVGREQQKPRAKADRFFLGSVLCICLVALFLRLLHVLETFGVPTSQSPVGDAAGYLAWASEIAAGNWFGETTFYQAPAYPYFLAVLQKIGGESLTMVRIVQGMMGPATVALIAFAGRCWFTRRIGLTAAAMLAVYPPAIYYDTLIQKAGLASFLLAAFLACDSRAACAYSRERAAMASACSLLAALEPSWGVFARALHRDRLFWIRCGTHFGPRCCTKCLPWRRVVPHHLSGRA